MMLNFHSGRLSEGKKDVNVAGSESTRAQRCFSNKKWCHVSRRQSSNSIRNGWMSVSGVAVIQPRKSSRQIPSNKHIFLVEVWQEANQIIPEAISNTCKVCHGLENIDKILPQYFTLRCSLFHCFVIHIKAFSASRTITFGLHSSEGCERCFSATSTTNPKYPRVSCQCVRLETDFSALARDAFCVVVFTRSFCCRSAKVADTRCAACGTRWGSGSAF